MRKIDFYTTDMVEGRPIEKYLGLVTASQVAGTNVIKDLTASFSDFFGGNSGAYRKAMNRLTEDAKKQLIEKAKDLKANAIVGVKISHSNISAQSKSMFMVFIQGTAVRLKEDKDVSQDIEENTCIRLEGEELEDELKRIEIRRKLKAQISLDEADWEVILAGGMEDIAFELYNKYHFNVTQPGVRTDYQRCIIRNFTKYITTLPHDLALDVCYQKGKIIPNLIIEDRLFDASRILALVKEDTFDKDTIKLLTAYSSSYTHKSLQDMKELAESLETSRMLERLSIETEECSQPLVINLYVFAVRLMMKTKLIVRAVVET